MVVIPGCETSADECGTKVHFPHILRTFCGTFASVAVGVGSCGGWWILGIHTRHVRLSSPIFPRCPSWLCGRKDRSSDSASFLSPTCLLCTLVDFCCGYLPSRIHIRHSNRVLHGSGDELCGPGSNGLEFSFFSNHFDRSRLDLSGDRSSIIPLTHFQLLRR